MIDISFDVESAGGTKLSNTGFVLHLLRSNFPFPLASALAPPVFERNFQRRLPSSRNLKSLIEILYRFIKVSLHFLSGFKANIADTRVFHLVCGTGKYQRALKLRTGKLSIDLCPGLKVK